jgi:hypothetical protein
VLRSSRATAPSWTGAGLVGVRSSRASLSLFQGVRCGGRTGASGTVSKNVGMATQWRVARTTLGSDSQDTSIDQRGGDSLLTLVPATCQSI